MKILPQKQFPLWNAYSKVFSLTPKTIFAYGGNIYSNYALTEDLLQHELRHLSQQETYGLDTWVKNFLTDPKKRLSYEVDAYKAQIFSVKNRELKNKIRIESSKTLSSSLYGNICTFEEAMKWLKY